MGWIPYALDRMDFEFEDRFRDLMKLKPSEYWQRQCKATFQYDPIGPLLVNKRDLMTEDTLMWGSDYPHFDSTYPGAYNEAQETFDQAGKAIAELVVHQNPTRYMGLPS